MYVSVWEDIFEKRDISLINTDSFDSQATVVTAQGDVEGIDAFRAYYNNYLTGFSDAQFKFIDTFGQGDKIVKHWNFKGTHDGELFGIPATNNKVDISGTTLVWMKDGKVLKEQDFFDNHSFLSQLGLL
jgi:predicted ester cyclase